MRALQFRRVEVHINKGIRPICSLKKYLKKYPRFKLTITTAKKVAKFTFLDGVIPLPKYKLDLPKCLCFITTYSIF